MFRINSTKLVYSTSVVYFCCRNALVQKLVAPHIESFDYLFEEGLKLAVESIPPMKIDVPNQPSITLWIEDAKIGKPVVKGSNGQMVST